MKIELFGTEIKVDARGLFCINDLHKASGAQHKHRPSEWYSTARVAELINELSKDGDIVIKKSPGRYGGTYICKDLVYDYAMWISPEFKLKVIQSFDRNKDVCDVVENAVSRVSSSISSFSKLISECMDEIKRLEDDNYSNNENKDALDSFKNELRDELKQLRNYASIKLNEALK